MGIDGKKEPDMDFNIAKEVRDKCSKVWRKNFKGTLDIIDVREENDFLDCELYRYELLKIDIVPHENMSIIKNLEDITSIKFKDIPLDDRATYDYINSEYFENDREFAKENLISIIKPKCMDDLIKINALTHGTGIWEDNAEKLIQNESVNPSDLICSRDDIMIFLLKCGYDREKAYEIAHRVRTGKRLTDEQYQEMLDNHKIPDWYPESCNKILYLFPRAHSVSCALNAYRIAYYRVHYPKAFDIREI